MDVVSPMINPEFFTIQNIFDSSTEKTQNDKHIQVYALPPPCNKKLSMMQYKQHHLENIS